MGRALAIGLVGNDDVVVSGTTSGTDVYPSGKRVDPLGSGRPQQRTV